MTLRVSFFLGSLAVASLAMAQTSFLTNDSAAVFYPPHYDGKQHQPSPIFEREPVAVNQLATDWPLHVSFSQKNGHSIAKIDIEDDVDLYGTGEVTGPLRRNGRSISIRAIHG